MGTIKIMPILDMKEDGVVKGIHFVDLKEAGDPIENAAFYEEEGADELAMLDIAGTVENRKTRLEWVRNVSSVIKLPLTAGGGRFCWLLWYFIIVFLGSRKSKNICEEKDCRSIYNFHP